MFDLHHGEYYGFIAYDQNTNLSKWKEITAMATSGKLDWHGCEDGTPPARPTDPDKAPERSHASGDSWKGQDDGTPSAKPTAPDKE